MQGHHSNHPQPLKPIFIGLEFLTFSEMVHMTTRSDTASEVPDIFSQIIYYPQTPIVHKCIYIMLSNCVILSNCVTALLCITPESQFKRDQASSFLRFLTAVVHKVDKWNNLDADCGGAVYKPEWAALHVSTIPTRLFSVHPSSSYWQLNVLLLAFITFLSLTSTAPSSTALAPST